MSGEAIKLSVLINLSLTKLDNLMEQDGPCGEFKSLDLTRNSSWHQAL